jgi:hypothetical protein
MNWRMFRRACIPCVLVASGVTGCVDQSFSSPAGIKQRQAASAGYTGCPPEQNGISDTKMASANVQTWSAMCNGKVYVCTAIYTSSGLTPTSMSCAPRVP